MAAGPTNVSPKQKGKLESMLQQLIESDGVTNSNMFWNSYNLDKQTVIDAFNKEAFSRYILVQIKISFQKVLGQFNSIQVIGCD